jgi:hypothetical protein
MTSRAGSASPQRCASPAHIIHRFTQGTLALAAEPCT